MKPPMRFDKLETKRELEALRLPETLREEPMELDALEMKPPIKFARLSELTVRAPPIMTVLDAESGPCTFRFDAKVEEAVVTWPDRRP